ncbi:MAG: class I adenylate-forming enzyme family protein [Syntrophobacteraceae bacterium]
MILGRSVGRNALLYPERAAIISEDGTTLSHRAFAERVWRLADGLARRGLGKNNRIAILALNSADYLCVYFAVGSLGAVLVPINNALKPADIDFRMAHAEVDAIFLGEEFAPVLDGARAATRRRLAGRIFGLDHETAGCPSLAALVNEGKPQPPAEPIDPEDTLYIGYTSGTTGPPKGAMVSHRAIVAGFLYKALDYALTDTDVTINPGPYWHSAPRDFAALALYLGGTAVVTTRFDASRYLELVERYRVTNSFVVPTMLQQLVNSPALQTCDVSSLRCLISGGAPLPTTVKERVLAKFGPVLTEFYGATETRIITAITPAELAVRDRSVGRPIRDVGIRILDNEGVDVPVGSVGEIYICGPGLFSGYWRDPESTRRTHRGEWFSLGDMGRIDAEGYLYLVDRKQDMIISGGENIFPNDIEECLLRHPKVKEAAVIGVPDELWGEKVVAFVVPVPEERSSAEELAAFCGERLPGYMKPRRVEFCDALPRNEVGKLLRRCLREAERDRIRPPDDKV